MNSTTPPRYQLASHVHACRVEKHVVFLDLKQDSYLGVNLLDCVHLSECVVGLPQLVDRSGSEDIARSLDSSPEKEHLLAQMLEKHMLTAYSSGQQRPSCISLERPRRALIDGYVDVVAALKPQDVAKFLLASVTATTLLRWSKIDRIVSRIRSVRHDNPNTPFEVERARRYVAVFNRLRPLVYTDGNECLFSSLTMQEFLRRCRLFPRLVFGVATDPFRAHCWLQYADMVVNDIPDYVREYTPILVV